MYKANDGFSNNWSIISMTGIGHAICNEADLTMDLTIKSVNQRALDIKYRMPPELSHMESFIGSKLAQKLSRGRIDVQVELSSKNPKNGAVLDQRRAYAFIKELNSFYEDLGETVLPLSMGDLLSLPGVITEGKAWPKEVLESLLKQALANALEDLLMSRLSDGQAISASIAGMLSKSQSFISQIEESKDADVRIHFEKLKGRCDELFSGYDVNLERIYQESALLAERSDFTEELHRLMAHVEFFILTCTKNEPKGRKMDFVCQEMLRESNTLLSKAFDHGVSILGIELKAEIEKIREQVQNIE